MTAREAPLTGEPQPVDNSTTGRSTTAAYRPHPFIDFPLWGLQQALADHKRGCSRCAGNLSAQCMGPIGYADMLRDKIERLGRG